MRPFPFDQLAVLDDNAVRSIQDVQRLRGPALRMLPLLREHLVPGLALTPIRTGICNPTDLRDTLRAGVILSLLDWDGRPVGIVHIDAPVVQGLAHRVLAGRPFDTLPIRPLLDVERSVVANMAELLLARAGLFFHVRLARFPDLGRVAVRTVFKMDLPEVVGYLTILLRYAPKVAASDSDELRSLVASSPFWAGRLVRANLCLATFALELHAYQGLEVGDVLLPKALHGMRKPERGILRFAGIPIAELALRWRTPIEGTVTRLAPDTEYASTLQAVNSPSENASGDATMDDKDASSGGPDSQGDVSSAPPDETLQPIPPIRVPGPPPRLVDIEVVAGDIRMPLKEALYLAPGSIVTLDVDHDAPVTLVVDGETIGRGELVDVDGRLGVRVVSLLEPLGSVASDPSEIP